MEARPFYLIAHRCNSPTEVEQAIKDGANAIECDLQYNKSKRVFVVNHDHADNPDRDALRIYLKKVKEIAKSCEKLALIIFDCKDSVAKERDIAFDLLTTIRTELELTNDTDTDINIILSVAKYKNKDFFGEILDKLNPKEGVAIDEEDNPSKVSEYFRPLTTNHCYANGLSTDNDVVDFFVDLFGINHALRRSIIQALLHKAESEIKLIYVWTLLDQNLMRTYLSIGVDGIFVDDVKQMVKVLKEEQFKNSVRLAEREKIAFELPSPSIYKIVVKTGNCEGAGTNANVYITLCGDRNSCEYLLDTPDHDDFETGQEHEYQLPAADVGNVNKVRIRHDGSGWLYSRWFLDWIKVQKDNQSWYFPCDKWLEKDTIDLMLNAK